MTVTTPHPGNLGEGIFNPGNLKKKHFQTGKPEEKQKATRGKAFFHNFLITNATDSTFYLLFIFGSGKKLLCHEAGLVGWFGSKDL